jgi:hypothetical protein
MLYPMNCDNGLPSWVQAISIGVSPTGTMHANWAACPA